MPIDPAQLMDRLRRLAAFEDDDAARRACDATLAALRRGLGDDDADWLALDLGPELAAPLVRGADAGERSRETFYRSVARFANSSRGVAREHAQVVCRALGEVLSPSTLARLRRCLPELALLFEPPAPEQPVAKPRRSREDQGPVRTLAGGRPGAQRPLCDARPWSAAELPAESPTRGHRHSVAVSDDPHGDAKLSGASGLSQERAGRSLSTWRPSAEKR